MQLNMDRLRSQLIMEERLRLVPYDDATSKPVPAGGTVRGKLTTGVGRNLDGNPLTPAEMAIIGHNGRTHAITHDQALMLLDNDIKAVMAVLDQVMPWWRYLDEVRARVMVDLCFNMGIVTFQKFKRFLPDMRVGHYQDAARDLRESLWYTQVGDRGRRLVKMIETGEDWKV